MHKVMNSVSENRSYMHFDDKKFSISHPKEFSEMPTDKRLEILDVLSYLKVSSIASISKNRILFEGLFDRKIINMIDKGTINNLPFVTEKSEGKVKTRELMENFEKRDFAFQNNGHSKIDIDWNSEDKALISLSFGKDSFLCYGLLDEIGLNPELAFINEFDPNDCEYQHKMNIKKTFENDTGKKVHVIRDETDSLYDCKDINQNGVNLYSSNVLLGYSLVKLNLAYSLKTKYLVSGCEQNLNDYYINSEGFKCYPGYDQSSEYTIMHNKIIKSLTSNQINVISPVEPIYNILEVAILKHRYPHLLKYIMSCDGTEKQSWCHSCPTCAKVFLYLRAAGSKQDLFSTNMFGKKYKSLYPLFSKPTRIYEKPEAVRDEQLLAMYLAYRNGFKGYLINKFKQELLDEFKEREDELHKRFLSVYKATAMPRKIENQLSSIFKEEIANI